MFALIPPHEFFDRDSFIYTSDIHPEECMSIVPTYSLLGFLADDMSFTVALSIVAVVLFLTNLTRLWKSWTQDPLSQFEGPFRLPLLGHLFTPTRWSPKKVFNEMMSEWFLQYQSPSTIYMILRSPVVLIYDPENVQIVVNKALEKGSDYRKLTRYYGNGIVTDNNTESRRNRRKLLFPSISLKVMGSYYLNEYNRLSTDFAKELEVLADTGCEIDLWPIVQNNICNTFLAAFLQFDEIDRKELDVPRFGRAVPGGLKHLMNRVFFPWLFSDIGNSIGAWISGKRKYFQDFDDSKRKILEKLESRGDFGGLDKVEGGEGTPKTFVETIYSKKGFELYTPEILMEEIMSFFMGTTDLMAITASFTLLILAMHEDTQEKVCDEIRSVVGDEDEAITLDVFNQLTLLDRCIKETLRLFPSVPWISRCTTKEIVLKDGRVLPSGCNVLLAIIGLHRDPKVYESPDSWIPDRFLPNEVAKRHPCSFIPFSIGGRKCLGYDNAFLLIKSQVVSFIRKYKLTTDMKLSDIDLNFDIHLRNDAGFRVYLQERN